MREVLLAVLVCFVFCGSSRATTVDFDYSLDSSGFFTAHPEAVASLNAAAAQFTMFTNSLSAIVPSGSNSWSPSVFDPSSGNSVALPSNLSVSANSIIVYVGARTMAGGQLFDSEAGAASASGSSDWNSTVSSRGQAGADAFPATAYGPWGGSISFASDAAWWFGQDTSGLSGKYDFQSAAIESLAQIFGFGNAASFERLAGTKKGKKVFNGTKADGLFGGPVPMDSTITYWQQGLMSSVDGTPQEVAMDATLNLGVRKYLTELDIAGMEDMGWSVPEPCSLSMIGMCGLALLGRGRRRRGQVS